MTSPRCSQIELSDGRLLAWVEYGSPVGTPILYLHGGNDCGLEGGWFAGDLEPRVRLIAPDRPGFGRSTMQPGRCFADIVPDMEVLLDHLGVRELPAFSLSGGGPHLLALGTFCDRITRIGVIASPCPYDTPGFLRGRPIRISGRRESGIAACPALVEFDQLFIQMQILDHRTHLEVEPLSKHLVRPSVSET